MSELDIMSSEAAAVKLLDELLVLFDLYHDYEDYNTVHDSLRAIARYKTENPNHPVTASLYNFMRVHGYLSGSNQ